MRLTLRHFSRKSNFRVTSRAKNFYAEWRWQACGQNILRDQNDLPSERLLQSIWQHQRLQRDQLKTIGGNSLRVLHPGFANVEGGPDFRGAVIQFGGEGSQTGDVEIDLRASGWRAHGHDQNPNFKNVILHVVWDEAVHGSKLTDPRCPTVLSLQNILDAPIGELSLLLEQESLRSLPENLRGKCCAPLRELSETQRAELLRQAARVRFENRAAQFRVRAKSAGWEQTLWENLFRALGYKHNVWPMQTLAEAKSRWSRGANSAFEIQARLLGVSGLLPDELTRERKRGDGYLRRVWDFWWRERDEFSDLILPRAVWKFHGLRPANHPQRRLALAAHWLADKNFVSNIENWIAPEISGKKPLDSLLEMLQVERDDFWSWHWTFKSARLPKPQPLLGAARVTDLAVNVILPWLWVRAIEGGNNTIQNEVERRFFTWPAAEDNSVLKLARQRLLGTSNACLLKSAAMQQGLIQIIRDFCRRSNALCEGCQFPELVRDWSARNSVI